MIATHPVESVFASFAARAYPYRFHGQLYVPAIAGGVPTDPRVAEAWLRTKLQDKDVDIRRLVSITMTERGITEEEATKIVDSEKHLNGFKRDEHGLYIEGRQLKAALKEAVSVAIAAGKLKKEGWGATRKNLLGFLAEHVFVLDDRLHLGITAGEFAERAPKGDGCGVVQRFVHTYRGNGIQYEEYVEGATIDFTVAADWDFTPAEWAMIWTTGQEQGIGASRSQGFGRYVVTRWEKAA